ncbi:uncharacterized protein DS421_18g621010 [Arachis hypogaea]|nr:uncharacterized protein DS421_18g621010 [Arachis hypogaea]
MNTSCNNNLQTEPATTSSNGSGNGKAYPNSSGSNSSKRRQGNINRDSSSSSGVLVKFRNQKQNRLVSLSLSSGDGSDHTSDGGSDHTSDDGGSDARNSSSGDNAWLDDNNPSSSIFPSGFNSSNQARQRRGGDTAEAPSSTDSRAALPSSLNSVDEQRWRLLTRVSPPRVVSSALVQTATRRDDGPGWRGRSLAALSFSLRSPLSSVSNGGDGGSDRVQVSVLGFFPIWELGFSPHPSNSSPPVEGGVAAGGDRPWVPSSSGEALLGPLRIVPPRLAVARSSELSSWRAVAKGSSPPRHPLFLILCSSPVVVAACIGFDVCAKELKIDQP